MALKQNEDCLELIISFFIESMYVYDVSRGTSKEDELFEYAEIPSYYKEYRSGKEEKEKKKDDFDLSLYTMFKV